jgi:hypothetical protein
MIFADWGTALLTCFTAVTMDSWSEVMWWTMDGYQPVAGGIFFISLMVRISISSDMFALSGTCVCLVFSWLRLARSDDDPRALVEYT